MSTEFAVVARGIVKTFNGKEVIKSCNMNVREGKIYGFLGPNGAGKTTIFKMLTGLLNPSMGEAKVFGFDVVKDRINVQKITGSIIEVPLFYEHLSAKENIQIHLDYMGVDNKDIEQLLKKVGLPNTSNQPVSEFSLGMRQRLGLARALSHNPRLLVLDEPINGLDPIGIREIRELFLSLAKNDNVTILISSHILSEIENIADMIGVIANGVVLEEVSLGSICDKFPKGLEDYFMNIMKGEQRNG